MQPKNRFSVKQVAKSAFGGDKRVMIDNARNAAKAKALSSVTTVGGSHNGTATMAIPSVPYGIVY